MKITSIIFALGAIVASVHAVVPDLSSVVPLVANAPAALGAPLGAASKRALPLTGALSNAPAVNQVLGSTGVVKRGLPAQLSTGTPADKVLEQAASAVPIPTKRGDEVDISVVAHDIAVVYVKEVVEVVAKIKAELVAEIKHALEKANVEITAELLAKISATVDLAVDAVVEVHIGALAVIEAKIKEIIEIHLTVGVHLKDVIDAILKDVAVYVHAQLEILIATIEKLDLVAKVLVAIKALIDVDVLALVELTLHHLVLDITVTVDAVVKLVVDLVAHILVSVNIN
ncbi:hypothetical protein BGZ52_006380 [Haplosporangium bisporale]|nr:hypothetical protein BGZ52_006380 [Haplosporangium bisporale]